MNQLSGYCEIKMGDEVLPFKFGTNSWALFCEMRKVEFHEIVSTGVFDKNLVARRDLYYCAHMAALRSKGEEIKHNLESFGDLLDETEGASETLLDTFLTAKFMGFTFSKLADKGEKKN